MFIIYTSIYKRPNPIIYDHSTTEKESAVARDFVVCPFDGAKIGVKIVLEKYSAWPYLADQKKPEIETYSASICLNTSTILL